MTTNQKPLLFEEIKKADEQGNEYWSARDLTKVLEYLEFRNFKPVIKKAQQAGKMSNQLIEFSYAEKLPGSIYFPLTLPALPVWLNQLWNWEVLCLKTCQIQKASKNWQQPVTLRESERSS